MRKEDKVLDKNEKCGRHDCDRKQYKLTKKFRPSFGLCKIHYIQYDITDPILDKIKKYWIIPLIIIAIFGIFNYFK